MYSTSGERDNLPDHVLLSIGHRGPDGSGVYSNKYIQLGHVRLAIIDLTGAGHQPMAYADGRYVVTFNGEIYNYLELKAELEQIGEVFKSHSDTEVLLAAYKVWGKNCVVRFRGMFAFALWDNFEKVLFLARDRCGEKPVFYTVNDSVFSFASELKGLLALSDVAPELDTAVVDMYLHYQFVPEPFTLIRNIHKLPAGHYLLVTPDSMQVEPVRYWDVEHVPGEYSPVMTRDEILCDVRNVLEDAIKMTLRSDVPVGVALSGGIDSGAIAAFAQKNSSVPLHAFCVGYPGRPPYDEREQARALADKLGMIVHEVELPVENFVNFFPDLVRIMDEPIADPAAFSHYSVPKAASAMGVKVLLSGIGGDEIFWGYRWVSNAVRVNQMSDSTLFAACRMLGLGSYSAQRILGKLANTSKVNGRLKQMASMLRQMGNTRTPTSQQHFYVAVPDFYEAFFLKSEVYGEAMSSLDPDNPFMPTNIGYRTHDEMPAAITRLLFDTWLASNCLTLGDRVSMGVGVETRLPFLDSDLIEHVMLLRKNNPDHMLGQKAWLRAALKGVLPDEVLERPKAGFQPPVKQWLLGVVMQYGDILRDGVLVTAGVIDKNKVNYMINELSRDNRQGLFFVYKLVLLEMWYKKVVMQ